ncbi:MAG: aromatic ring-hydroxylating dioxygenase subunit alpha [Rhodospirillaceae bacterium]|jgi:carnitine monooxygenase subunit|nr:aromatic ring-hydroxylating dioxygenase subunit alpha [Rhodospirillaceae bacterium]MBT6203483.1 aromatic ring-hydroxylating dioxygenase subunit alpha [Rhodospirillaceae bacterium]MBT6510449.1 aromatic ring-hydroxylating dioxygenase subunit alpha [Rhodospirillaceae bacterium]
MSRQAPDLGRFDADPDRSFNMPAAYYTDPEIFEREKEAIFFKSWRFVGHVTEMPETGDYLTQDICGENVFVVRDGAGDINGFYNVCQHRAHELVRGRRGNVKAVITCPYHAWAYGLDGALRTARFSEKVAGFDKSDFGLSPIRVEIFCGFVFVNLDAEAKTIRECAPGFEETFRAQVPDLDRMVWVDQANFDIAANWKVVAENGLDGYHVFLSGPAHKALGELMDGHNLDMTTHEGWAKLHAHAGTGDNKAYGYNTGTGQTDEYVTMMLWPDLLLFTLPGANGVWSFLMAPEGPERTREEVAAYMPDGAEMDAATKEAVRYMNEVLGPEDVGLNTGVQKGLNSRGYRQGRLMVDEARSDMSEHTIHFVQLQTLKALGDVP